MNLKFWTDISLFYIQVLQDAHSEEFSVSEAMKAFTVIAWYAGQVLIWVLLRGLMMHKCENLYNITYNSWKSWLNTLVVVMGMYKPQLQGMVNINFKCDAVGEESQKSGELLICIECIDKLDLKG